MRPDWQLHLNFGMQIQLVGRLRNQKPLIQRLTAKISKVPISDYLLTAALSFDAHDKSARPEVQLVEFGLTVSFTAET